MFETNVFGTVALTSAAIPTLRDNQPSVICTITSSSIIAAVPFYSAYRASKAAASAFCDSLRVEVAPFGIRVVEILPGPVDTDMFRLSTGEQVAARFPDYRALSDVAGELRRAHADPRVVEPAAAASAIVDAIVDSSGPMRYGCDPVSHELMDLWRQSDDETVFALTGQGILDQAARTGDEPTPADAGATGRRAPTQHPARWRFGRPARATFGGDRKVLVQLDVVFAVFPIIFLGELPDKTMFASLVLSTRGRPFPVWLGAAAAFAIHVVIAVTIGVALFHLLPHRALEAIVAAMFFVGGVLALREARKEQTKRSWSSARWCHTNAWRVTAFVVIFMAEWGDLTQILTANLAAHYHDPLSVGVGALLALWAVAALAVLAGQSVLRLINIATIRIVTAVVLFGLTGWAIWEAAR